VIAIDNGSSDTTCRLLAGLEHVDRVIANDRNLGWAGAANQGIRICRGIGADYMLLMNADVRINDGLLHELVGFLQAHPDYAAVGPLQVNFGDVSSGALVVPNSWTQEAIFAPVEYMERFFPRHNAVAGARTAFEVAYAQGSCVLLRWAAYRDVGEFDESFFLFHEEVDFFRRARWRGWRVALTPNTVVEHANRDVSGRRMKTRYYRVRNRYLFALTDPTVTLTRAVRFVSAQSRRDLRYHFRDPAAMAVWFRAQAWLVTHACKIASMRRQRVQERSLSAARRYRDSLTLRGKFGTVTGRPVAEQSLRAGATEREGDYSA
jgi:GT2 family glycosyltransferase